MPNYLFEFELKRLDFSIYGSLKNQNNKKLRMLLLTIVLVRILLGKILCQRLKKGKESDISVK